MSIDRDALIEAARTSLAANNALGTLDADTRRVVDAILPAVEQAIRDARADGVREGRTQAAADIEACVHTSAVSGDAPVLYRWHAAWLARGGTDE